MRRELQIPGRHSQNSLASSVTLNATEIPRKEYARRLGRLVEVLEGTGLSGAYVSSPANVAYLTGVAIVPMERLIALVVSRAGKPALIVPALEGEHARASPAEIDVVEWQDAGGPAPALRRVFARTGLDGGVGRVAVEKDVVTVRLFEMLRELLELEPEPSEDASPILTELRMRKSPSELALVRRAAEILDAAFTELPGLLRAGRTEAAVAFELERLLRRGGAEKIPFETVVLGGPNGALPHGGPGSRELAEGDLVVVDAGVSYGGYCADVTRTFAIGEPGERARGIYEVVREAQEAACHAVVEGATCAEVDAAARTVIERAGYGEYFVHRTGHGLGLEVHEPPSLMAGNDRKVSEGMVVTVEPGIYVPGFAGVRIEDDLAVVNGWAERLTRTTRELLVCPPD